MSNGLGLGIIVLVVIAGAATGLFKFFRFAERTEHRRPPEEWP